MKTASYVAALIVTSGISATSAMADNLAEFDGGIGVIPVSSGVGTSATAEQVNRNIVRGVPPPGQIWVIKDLKAEVKTNGRITVEGKGLILAGGNNIGTSNNLKVFATLICEAAAPFRERSTATVGVQLAPNGDFRIDDILDPAPTECASPALLIRNTAGNPQPWFAAGIPKLPGLSDQQPDSSQMRSPFGR